jgi:hypothetical protein
MFDEATVQRLADDYGRELEALVEHCCTLQERSDAVGLPAGRAGQAGLDSLPVPLAQIEDIYPLSPMQQGMLFHTVYEHSGDYINQMRLEVEGLEPARFAAAWQACVDDHDVLRSSFLWQGLERPLQVIRKSVRLNLRELDWRDRATDTAALDQLAADERAQGFDPAEPPLLRLLLVRLGEQRHHLIYTSHHILMDGWSNSRLMGEVLQRYRARPCRPRRGATATTSPGWVPRTRRPPSISGAVKWLGWRCRPGWHGYLATCRKARVARSSCTPAWMPSRPKP